jgi:hypothetical protein
VGGRRIVLVHREDGLGWYARLRRVPVPYPRSELFLQLFDESRIEKNGASHEAFLSGNVYNEVSGMKSWSEHISDRSIKILSVGRVA